jgi:hypothetical protein
MKKPFILAIVLSLGIVPYAAPAQAARWNGGSHAGWHGGSSVHWRWSGHGRAGWNGHGRAGWNGHGAGWNGHGAGWNGRWRGDWNGRWRGDWNGHWRGDWDRDWGDCDGCRWHGYYYGGAVAAGLVLGAATYAPSYGYPVYYGGAGHGRSANWIAACSAKYRSFNPQTGMYLGYDGQYHHCRLP